MSSQLGSYNLPSSYSVFEKALQKCTSLLDQLSEFQKLNRLCQTLIQVIDEKPGAEFLLPDLLKAFDWIEEKNILKSSLHITDLEFWLNHFSGKTEEEQIEIRSKITGKKIPRDAYQIFFPIGMQKSYPGSHFVCAHLSPDLDTTVASFIGWLDAFSARVGTGNHIWSLPGGPADPYAALLLEHVLGVSPIPHIARTAMNLTLTAKDLLERVKVKLVSPTTLLTSVDSGLHETAVLMVDQDQQFLGDWHSVDAEKVRPILFLFHKILASFEIEFNKELLHVLSSNPTQQSLEAFVKQIPHLKLNIPKEASEEEVEQLNQFISKILGLKTGLNSSIKELAESLVIHQLLKLNTFLNYLQTFPSKLQLNNCASIFQNMEDLLTVLSQATQEIQDFSGNLEMGIKIKTLVLEKHPIMLTLENEVEEIRSKMQSYDYLPVVMNYEEGTYSLGIVRASTLNRLPLGTISLRDFSNLDETHMASYLTVISAIDHHKIELHTDAPALIVIGDAQSCNTLVAELLFQINDQFRKSAPEFYIHPNREIAEYFSCLHAILDDTDLLNKASGRDVECVVSLLNRLKILTKQSTEACISLKDIPRDSHFVSKSVARILQNPDMYSIYAKLVESKEAKLKTALNDLSTRHFSFLFSDTKEQNGCCRIGQTKVFSDCVDLFLQKSGIIRKEWLNRAENSYQTHHEMDLHLQMISTIPSAKDLYTGQKQAYTHTDELWLWNPSTLESLEHVSIFLNRLNSSPHIEEKLLKCEIYGDPHKELETIIKRNLSQIKIERKDSPLTFAIFYIKAGSLNSRKSMISPYLPKR